MAHQVRIGTSVQSGPRMILQRPELAALLGAVAAEWSVLESRLMSLYAYLMGVYLPRTDGFQPPIHPVALQVFDTLETNRLRLDLLRKLGSWVLKDDTLQKELETVVSDAVRGAARLRNTLVHAHWGITPDYPDALILLPVFGHQLAYQQTDFDQAIERIIVAYKSIGSFESKARQHLDGPNNSFKGMPLRGTP